MRFVRQGTRVSLVAVAALVLAACGHSGKPSDSGVSLPAKDPKASIQLMGPWPDQTMAPVIEHFETDHPSIKVKYDYVPAEQLNGTLESRMTAKTGDPDVYAADMPRVPALASRGYTADLTKAFGSYTKRLYASTVDATTVDGHLQALPVQTSTQYLFYNKDLLRKAGLKPPGKDPGDRLTWEQVEANAKKAQHAGAQWGLEFVQVGLYYQLEALPVSLGGSPGATGKDRLTPDVNGPEWVKAFQWYGKLFKEGVTPRGIAPNQQTTDMFLHGKIAYFASTPFLFGQLAQQHKFSWGFAPFPYFTGGKPVTPTGSWAFAINPFSKHKDAAAVFLKYLALDNDSSYAKYSTDPVLPAYKDAMSRTFALPAFKAPEAAGAQQLTEYEQAHSAVNRVRTVGYLEFEDIVNSAFSDIANGTPAKEALDKAQSQLTRTWKKYK